MKAIVYRVILLEPTLVTELEGDPNSAIAFDYLPGSTLRGAFINRYLHSHGLTDLAADPTARRLFFDGHTRYLNGYRLDRRHRRTLPTPQSWYETKVQRGDKKTVYDFALQEPSGDIEENPQWQRVSKPFCVVDRDEVRLLEPERWITVHTARTRRFGRAMSEERIEHRKGDLPGAVFRYNALAAEQVFEAAILCDQADESALTQFISGEITLGKSRSGGYGRAQLQLLQPQPATWYEYDSVAIETWDTHADNSDSTQDAVWHVPDECLVVTLLSDALLRDANGQFTVDSAVVKTVLEQELACVLDKPRAFLSGRVIGGFNRKWGLPLPQTLAIAMGSVFVYHVSTLSLQKVRALLEHGIGERRAEGFGRLAINWQIHPKLECNETALDEPAPGITLSPEAGAATTLATRMVARLLRQKLDRKVIELANDVSANEGESMVMKPAPRNAQLSRLRSVIADALMQSPPALSLVTDYLNDIEQRATARKQYEHARLQGQNLLEWLKAILTQVDEQAGTVFFHLRSDDLRGIGGITPTLADSLRHEYLLRYVDAVLVRATKQNRQEE